MGVPPAALPEAGEPLVPPRPPVPVEDPADLVDVGRGRLEEAVGPLRGREAVGPLGRRRGRGPRAVLGSREKHGVKLVVVTDAAADVAAPGGPARWRGDSSRAKLSLK